MTDVVVIGAGPAGRFENLVTGQQRQFASSQKLPDSIGGARG